MRKARRPAAIALALALALQLGAAVPAAAADINSTAGYENGNSPLNLNLIARYASGQYNVCLLYTSRHRRGPEPHPPAGQGYHHPGGEGHQGGVTGGSGPDRPPPVGHPEQRIDLRQRPHEG